MAASHQPQTAVRLVDIIERTPLGDLVQALPVGPILVSGCAKVCVVCLENNLVTPEQDVWPDQLFDHIEQARVASDAPADLRVCESNPTSGGPPSAEAAPASDSGPKAVKEPAKTPSVTVSSLQNAVYAAASSLLLD